MHDIVFFYPEGHQRHAELGHPERPERVETIRQAMDAVGWWETYPRLEAQEVPDELLESVHEVGYLDQLQAACRQGRHLDMDTYTTPASWDLALNAAGGALAVANSVWTGEARRGFALTRPPGHHATSRQGMGFCLLNNIALAGEYLIQEHVAQRLAIIDLDLHHGNGTQDIFWQRGEVFYLSTHQSPLYPGTGRLSETGAGEGSLMTANIPFPPGSGDKAFTETLDTLILPLLDRFMPQMVLVSYGFDPHWRDPLGHLQLSAQVYGRLVAGLAAWADARCGGRIILCLEGGYDLEAAAACSLSVTSALLGEEWQDSLGASPQTEGRSWQPVLQQARQIWGL
ncbi:MAG: histone deacetylase family protein [Anaerolineales bacterium]